MDWQKIKKDYVSSNITYKQLSEKYGVSHSQLMKVGAREKWSELRKTAERKAEEKFVEKVATENSKIDDAIFSAAMKLMEVYLSSLNRVAEDDEPVPPSMLKDYGTALKSIQSVLERPTQLDIDEQKARIDKLRKDTERGDHTTGSITVRLEGDVSGYAV